MATKNTTLRNKMADDFGLLWNSGTLVIKTSGGTVLATFTLGADAFAAASAGRLPLTVCQFQLRDPVQAQLF